MKAFQLILQTTFFLCFLSVFALAQPVSWDDLSIDGETVEFKKEKVTSVIKKTIIDKPRERLSEGEIRKIAEEFQLFNETEFNPHLALLSGDIAFWYEQRKNENAIRREFAARRIILDAAEESEVVIKDNGVLAWASQQIMRNLILERKNLKD